MNRLTSGTGSQEPSLWRKSILLAMALTLILSLVSPGIMAQRAYAATTIDYDQEGRLEIYKYDESKKGDESLIGTEGYDENYGLAIDDVTFSYLKVGEIHQHTEVNEDGAIETTIAYSIRSDLYDLIDAAGGTSVLEEEVCTETDDDQNSTTYYTASSLDDALAYVSASSLRSYINTAIDDDNIDDDKGRLVTGETNSEAMGHAATSIDDEDDYILSVGLYLVVETAWPAEVTTTASAFFVSIPMTNDEGDGWNYNVTAYPKNSTSTFDISKSVVDEDGNELPSIDAQIGQILDFVVRADLPASVTIMESYTITDVLSAGLDFVAGTYTVYGLTSEGDLIELTEGASQGQGDYYLDVQNDTPETGKITLEFSFTIDSLITQENNNDVAAYTQIWIEYQAMLNEDAVVGSDGNLNDIDLFFDTGSGEEINVSGDSVTIYTYEIDLTKIGDGDATNRLRGVTFQLWKANDSENPSFDNATEVDVALSEDESYYYVIGELDVADPDTLTTNELGQLVIHGLEAGVYYLEEVTTSDGYNLLADPIEIQIISNESSDERFVVDSDGTYHKANLSTYDGYDGYALDVDETTDPTTVTAFAFPDGFTSGWVNFGTNTIYRSENSSWSVVPGTEMYKDDGITWSVLVDGVVAIEENNLSTSQSDGIISITVNNQTGFDLPLTGGQVFPFLLIGGLIVTVAVASIYVVSRKKTVTENVEQ